ncbi:MAG: MurT ligase domain-containing protein [bacterium]
MKLLIACLIGKLGAVFLKILGFSASTWPGHLSLKLDPHLVEKLESRLPCGSVVVSGTNGKTTTANMIAYVLTKAGYQVIHNNLSANLLNGIATSLVLSTKLTGTYPHYGDKSVGVFEIDEAVFPKALSRFTPEVVVLLNLSRDQLDRYGEVDLLVSKWREALLGLERQGSFPKVVYCSDDKRLQEVVGGFPEELSCPVLKQPQFSQTNVRFAVTVASLLGVSAKRAEALLAEFRPVFGRGEAVLWHASRFHLYLAKNPQSFNENLKFWLNKAGPKTAFWLLLNDNIPDGRDVSWIWDIDSALLFKLLRGRAVYISGRRAYDMALRLKYAGLDSNLLVVTRKVREAAENIAATQKEVVVFPTYSAMLEVRKVLTGKRI